MEGEGAEEDQERSRGEREVRGREGYGEGKRGCEVRGVKEGEVRGCKT